MKRLDRSSAKANRNPNVEWLRQAFVTVNLGIFIISSLILLFFACQLDHDFFLAAGGAGLVLGAAFVLIKNYRQNGPLRAAVFALGGLLPVLTVFVLPDTTSVSTMFGSSLFFLAVFGLIAANIGGVQFWMRTVNTAVGGVVSMLLALGVGTVLRSFMRLL